MSRIFPWGLLLGLGPLPWMANAEVDHTRSLSVVQVRTYPGPGKVAYGSGVVVGPDRVVTNCHVTRPALKISVSKGPMQFPAVTQQVDTRHDLCLLTTPGLPFPKANLGDTTGLKLGQPLYLYGYPRALGIAYSEGKVEALHPFDGGRVIETSANFDLGASGGGLFDEAGKLVGLATFMSAGHAGGYFAVPVDWIAELRKRAAQEIGPLQGMAFWEDRAALPAFLKPPGR